MRVCMLFGASLVAVLALDACAWRAKDTSSPVPSASASAAAAPARKPVRERACRLGTPITASAEYPPDRFSLAASPRGVVLTGIEARFDDALVNQTLYEVARVFDGASLTPSDSAVDVDHQANDEVVPNGIAPFVLADGSLGVAVCTSTQSEHEIECTLRRLGDPTPMAHYVDDVRPGSEPKGDRIAATGVGDAAIAILPQCQEVRVISSANPSAKPMMFGATARWECEPKAAIGSPAMAALGDARAAAIWVHHGVIEGRTLRKDGTPDGPLTTLSGPDSAVAPSIVGLGAGALVAYTVGTAPGTWGVELTHWRPDGSVVRARLKTGAEHARSGDLAATEDDACVLFAWTEGRGAATHVRAGIVCDDELVLRSVVDVSSSGVEADDPKLARRATGSAYVAWMESHPGRLAETKMATVICE